MRNGHVFTFAYKASRFAIDIPLQSRAQLDMKLQETVTAIAKLHKQTTQRVHSDNVKEYRVQRIKKYMASHGIVYTDTTQYQPLVNVIPDRCNRSLIEAVRCTLRCGPLRRVYDDCSILDAVYKYNLITHAAPEQSPMAAWYLTPPAPAILYEMGTSGWLPIPPVMLKTKLPTRARAVAYFYAITAT